ncbi:uncharacterized protein RSE6_13167 [Rhynchosporium secalis]|uniref:Uncharacterized protein n=1 Tax=Rhynchosporium secalis TaxID=38038 RepID=A0A1E1MSA9_RHYSE|nr:uncharacterized protein RSE6_13167 [Rhynchosporium secalis]
MTLSAPQTSKSSSDRSTFDPIPGIFPQLGGQKSRPVFGVAFFATADLEIPASPTLEARAGVKEWF